jgi:GNAT superfamily N-acetyltransferase
MPIHVRKAGPERVDDLAVVMGRALAVEPMIAWPFLGSDEPDVERATALLRLLLEVYVAAEVIWEDSDGHGCAAWIPPGQIEIFESMDAATRGPVAELTDDGGIRYDAFWDWLGSHLPDEPCWFLDMVGVDPAHQGRGIGRALIQHGLDGVGHAPAPAFLETGTPSNVGYYERLGFRVVADEDAPNGGPHVWFMRREP